VIYYKNCEVALAGCREGTVDALLFRACLNFLTSKHGNM
jgi:hypothetical protein